MSAVGAPRLSLLLVAIVATLVAIATTSATTRVVPSPATPTIASALAASANGDSVDVLPGTYFEHGLSLNREVTLRGVAGAAQTIIDAQGLGRVITVGDMGGGVIEGLTITHGAASSGAGVYGLIPNSILTIRGCVITENHATGSGGAVAFGAGLSSPPLSILDTVLSHNSAGAGLGGALDLDKVTLTLTGSLFQSDSASSGGAINIGFSSGRIVGCLFVGNTATTGGGGIYVSGGSDLTLQDCTFYGNSAPFGGALQNITARSISRTIIALTNSNTPISCADATFSCCDTFGNSGGNALCGTDGGGNFSLDALFCDAAGGDLRLNENSPCLPGHHPNGVDCGGTIGALGVGCGVGTGVDDRIEAAPWSRVKTRYR